MMRGILQFTNRQGWRLVGAPLLAALILSLIGFGAYDVAFSQAAKSGSALLLTFDGPLTQPKVEYVQRGLEDAQAQGAEVVILQLNTPGGSVGMMSDLVEMIRTSEVPVVVWVAPRGAMAGSAGTLITLAGHAAAMAPETTIGAASPIDMSGQDLETTLEAKEKNILKATARSLAARRPPAAIRLAESTIESAQAVAAEEALKVGLVDFIATDANDLLRQLDGFSVHMSGGERTLHTAEAVLQPVPATFIEQLLDRITDPNIIVLLLNLGVMAILIEIATPGGWVAGFTGVVCIALATYGLGILPVNWFGLVFLALAFVLFILDIKAPTHGALTAAGIGSLIVSSLVLFNTVNDPGIERVSLPVVIASSLFTGGAFFGMMLFGLRAQKEPVRMGQESLLGRAGVVTMPLNPRGQVRVGGEQWSAQLAEPGADLPAGTRVRVLGVNGLWLSVEKVADTDELVSQPE